MEWKKLMTDHQIVARVLSGRRDDFEVLVVRHLPMARALAYSQLGTRSEAEDVVQESFVKAFTDLDRLQKPESFRYWLAAIVRNLANTALRREVRDANVLPALAQSGESPHPAREIERRELLHLLESEIGAMDEQHREVLMMHYFGGLRLREVAEALNVSREVAAKRLQRARQALGERVLGVLDTSAAAKPEPRDPRVKAIMGIIGTVPVAWEQAAAGVAAAGLWSSVLVKALVATAAVAAVVLVSAKYVRNSEEAQVRDEAAVVRESVASQPVSEPVSSVAAAQSPVVLAANKKEEEQARGDGIVTGAVLDPSGAPLANASIRVEVEVRSPGDTRPQRFRYSAASASDGRFRVENLPLGLACVKGGVPGELVGGSVVILSEDFPEWFVWLETTPAARIAGRVVDAHGAPVAGATVTPVHFNGDDIRGLHSRVMRAAETSGPGGEFAFTWLWPGDWQFEVTSPGFATVRTENIATGTEDAQIVATDGGSIHGIILAADTDRAIPGANVEAYRVSDESSHRAETTSDSNGAFRVEHLAAGRYAIRAATANDAGSGGYYLAEEIPPFEVEEGAEAPALTVHLAPGAALSGIVIGPDGLPSAKHPVTARQEKHTSESLTDSKGRFRIAALPPGDYEVSPWPRYQGAERSISLAAAEVREDIEFRYPQGVAAVSGKVMDLSGQPMEGVEVSALDQFWNRVLGKSLSNADGSFRIEDLVPADMLWLRPKKPGWVGEDTLTKLTERGMEGLEIRMGPPARVAGRVVDASGKPVPDVVLWALNPEVSVYTGMSSKTTQGGRFAFTRLNPGEYTLTVERESSPAVEAAHVSLAPGELREDLTVVFAEEAGLAIAGRVVDASGRPVTGALMNLEADQGMREGLHALCGRDGRFSFSGLKPGTYRLRAHQSGFSAAMLEGIEAGREDVVIALQATGSVEGRVFLEGSSEPLTEFAVAVLDDAQNRLQEHDKAMGVQVQNEQGIFRVGEVSAGTHTVAIWADGYAPALQTVDVTGGQAISNLVFWLKPDSAASAQPVQTMTVRGRAIDVSGVPIAGASIFLNTLPSSHERLGLAVARSGDDGAFIAEGIPVDTRRLVATHATHAPAVAPVQGSAAVVTLTLPEAGAVAGVLRRNGSPLANAFISAKADVEGVTLHETAHTDAAGLFTIRGLPAGQAELFVWTDDLDGGRGYSQVVEVHAAGTTTADFDLLAGTAEIRGVLLIDEAPARGNVKVLITAATGDTNQFILNTDDEGGFHLSELPAGEAQLTGMSGPAGRSYTGSLTLEVLEEQSQEVTLPLTLKEE